MSGMSKQGRLQGLKGLATLHPKGPRPPPHRISCPPPRPGSVPPSAGSPGPPSSPRPKGTGSQAPSSYCKGQGHKRGWPGVGGRRIASYKCCGRTVGLKMRNLTDRRGDPAYVICRLATRLPGPRLSTLTRVGNKANTPLETMPLLGIGEQWWQGRRQPVGTW